MGAVLPGTPLTADPQNHRVADLGACLVADRWRVEDQSWQQPAVASLSVFWHTPLHVLDSGTEFPAVVVLDPS